MAKPVYALVGSDSFLQLEKLADIRRQLAKDVQSIDVDGERAELAEVLDELRSFSMFGSGKLVAVRSADDFITRYREQMENYVAAPVDSGVLVLRCNSLPKNQRIYKLIEKHGAIEYCDPPPLSQLPKWIISRAKSAHGLAIEPAAAAMLADYIGSDLGRLDGELAKLSLQVESKAVTQQAILDTVSFQREHEMNVLTNELVSGRPVEALRRWRQLTQLDTSAEHRAVFWLSGWLEDVGTILAGESGKVSWKYRDRLPQMVRTANQLGAAKHRAAVNLLAELDRRTKTGLGDAGVNVERFILALAQ